MKGTNKTKMIQTRIAEDEYLKIKRIAGRFGCSISELIRNSALGYDCEEIAGTKKLMPLLCKLADMVNTIENSEIRGQLQKEMESLWPF